MEYCIYKHTSPSGKSYIGQTNDYKRRCIEHNKPSNGSLALAGAIKKHGWDNFTHEILKDGLTIEEANSYEELYIKEHKTLKPYGYNLTTGGGNAKLTEEVKEKIRTAHQGVPLSDSHKAALAKARIGRKLSDTHREKIGLRSRGRKMPPESVEKTRIANIGKVVSEETRRKIGLANTGNKHSEEWKAVMSFRNSGEGNPNYGKVATEETRLKISEGGKKRFKEMDHPMLGRKHSEEAIEKMRKSKLGIKRGPYKKTKTIEISNV